MTHDYAGLQRLAVRRNQVLAAMSVLSDAPGASFVSNDKRGKASTKAPTTASGGESLHALWRDTFDVDWPAVPDDPDQAALDWCYDRAYRLVMQAEADLHWATGQLDTTTTGDPVARDKRIVKAYEGRPAVEVAHLERCSTASVRAIRRQFGRDPLTGRQTTRGKR